ERSRVRGGTLVRILAGLPTPVEECPVARLHREELPGRTLGGPRGEVAAFEPPEQPKLESARGPCQVRDLGRVPRAEVLPFAPSRSARRPPLRRVARERLRERDETNPPVRDLPDPPLEPGGALRPPVTEELGVDGEGDEPGLPASLAKRGQASRD